ncbi:hypothetical protein LTR62_005409 [Meristemomyces frigidus]|uniref:Uncharacterized protein n=1 Tax=Meristemomyces frigidus TaxID=1508187 RepID=A0AAN7TE28_9PEZI|nr:hypothetical protein LTR62_005409 [Meristemomyces frigidus]
MPPIPVHIDDPITPAKPQGVTPQTAASGRPASQVPASVPVTTTQAAVPPYPAAQPGAAAAPAPTPYLLRPQPEPTRTSSTQEQDVGPPPPQPGAVPSPYSHATPMTGANGLQQPPPPRAGEAPQKQGTAFTAMISNVYTPPAPAQNLQQNYAPTHSTSTVGTAPGQATTPMRIAPTTLNFGPVASPAVGSSQDRRVSSEHPAGYVQNVYAQDMSPAQRASLDQDTRGESFVSQLGLGGVGSSLGDGMKGSGGGGRVGEGWSEGVEGAWSAAKGWLGKAGEVIAEGEEEVWKRINGRS